MGPERDYNELSGHEIVAPSSNEMDVAALIQHYYEGSCTSEERAYIERNDDLLARVAALRRENTTLQQLFAGAARPWLIPGDWPSPQELIGYVDGTLEPSRQRFIEQCVQRHRELGQELRLLRLLGRNPLTSE